MDNWDTIAWVLVRFAVLSLIIERALYVVFEWDAWQTLETFIEAHVAGWLDLKPPISMAVGILIALITRIDLIAVIFPEVSTATLAGMLVTGLYLAGGSKAVFLMFQRIRDLRDAKLAEQLAGVNAVIGEGADG